jgi:GTP-binding protein
MPQIQICGICEDLWPPFLMKVTSAEFVTSAAGPEGYPNERLPEVSFMGKSNVGKSSLLNSLLNKKLARTSNTPGRTQLINYFRVNKSILFVDLPGYGYAKVPLAIKKQWGAMVENYLANRKELVLSILILDSRHAPTANDLQLKSWLEHTELPFIVVSTKADRLSNNQLRSSLRVTSESLGMGLESILPYSSVTGRGADRIWKAITDRTELFRPN